MVHVVAFVLARKSNLFQSVSVKGFVEFMLFWKMLIDYLQKELTNFCFWLSYYKMG